MQKKILFGVIVLFVLFQFVPYGKDHKNPTIGQEPQWDTQRTKELFVIACNDCHSHKTKWPWYSNIAPVSWAVYYHVQEGREHFNVSMWGMQEKNDGDEAAKEMREGEMPVIGYLLAHPEARLEKEEKAELVNGLVATFGEEEEDKDIDENTIRP